MHQAVHTIVVPTNGKSLVDITEPIADWLEDQKITTGLLTVFCRHTSASLMIQENADPHVRSDIMTFYERMVPEDPQRYVHNVEGSDDMPAHLKASLTETQVSIPVLGGRLMLGVWQGVHVFEHRRQPQQREVVLHLIGE